MLALVYVLAALQSDAKLSDAIRMYQEARFGESLVTLESYIAERPPVHRQAQAKLYMGMNFLSLGNQAKAREMFQQVLELDGDFQVPQLMSPTARNAFNQVKASYRVIPRLAHSPPHQIDAAKGAALAVRIERMRPAYAAKVFFRARGNPTFGSLELTLREPAVYRTDLPTGLLMAQQKQQQSYVLEYYIEVSDGVTAIARLRDASTPFAVPVSVPVNLAIERPIARRWWFWTVLGGALVVAGGAAAAIYIFTRPGPTVGNSHVVFDF